MNLNEAQHQAVTSTANHQLVIAGAGSGKTRVLVDRILWLSSEQEISPYNILAVTFTNKAAAEIKARLSDKLGSNINSLWVGTFHGIAHRLLRQHWEPLGLAQNFQILDSEDQKRLLRRIIKSLNLDEKEWPARSAQSFIGKQKNNGLRPENVRDNGHYAEQTWLKVYQTYEQTCRQSELIDFGDLLMYAHELWLNHPEILKHYQQRFQHILVDEFQDTNAIQYAWLSLLAGNTAHMMAVGDDDQSIYGWRGAQVENIHRFTQDFPKTETIRLEQNYRSTGTILKAANALIANNGKRMGKNLWTAQDEGDLIHIYAAFNELDEAKFIVGRVKAWLDEGRRASEVALLYRSNAQSRVLEEAFLQSGINYRIYGGLRFFERAEIKDVLSYLRLIANRQDSAAFERVVNTPTRGIGERTIAMIREEATSRQTSLWDGASHLLASQQLSARASSALAQFIDLITTLDEATTELELPEQTEHVIKQSGLWQHYQQERSARSQAKLENLDELVTAAQQFAPEFNSDIPLLSAFLTHAALEAGERGSEENEAVQLMTLHTAKGLEFPLVFMCGVEEGIFPHYMTYDNPDQQEEERRLCYVGMTRAMERLFLTFAEIRQLHGKRVSHKPSRFIREIPQDLVKEVGLRQSRSAPSSYAGVSSRVVNNDCPYQLGQRVTHKKFGSGTITGMEGQGEQMRIQVHFKKAGAKWLMLQFANLSV